MHIYIIVLNILIGLLLAIAIVFLMMFSGKGITMDFLLPVWPLGLFLLLTLGGINIIFLVNRKLLTLLDKEDWPALAVYLEKKIYQDTKYSSRYVKLLTQAYLILGKYKEIISLKDRAALEKPALVDECALAFGAALLLNRDTAAAAEFFQARLDKGQAGAEWVRWYYGFSLLLGGSVEPAGVIFGELAAGANDALIAGLSAHFLNGHAGRSAAGGEWLAHAETGKNRVRASVKTVKQWAQKAHKINAEVHGAVIRKYLDEAGAWIFGGAEHEKH